MSLQEELSAVLREHGALIARIARSHESDRGRAEDLVQDICLAIWEALPRFRGAASMRTYIARIAHNRAVSHIARETRVPPLAPLDPYDDALPSERPSPEDEVAERDARRRLERAVRELPLALKVAVTLALEGFSADEVAAVLGISTSAAGVRLHRAKAALQERLEEGT